MQQSHVHVYQALTGLVNSLIAFLGNWLQEEQLHPSTPFHRGHLLINKSFQISTFVMLDKQKKHALYDIEFESSSFAFKTFKTYCAKKSQILDNT